MTDSKSPRAAAGRPRQSFAALRDAGFRSYFIYSAFAMMADSIEHVISYWMIFQKFHSPALAGFAIIAHWLPTLLFGVFAGALADKYNPRRLIQVGMVLFMSCSLIWGILFTTGWLEWWHAVVILTIHGIASVFWGTPGQVILHDIVGRGQLPSAVRLNATSRYLGLLAGPAVGGAILLALGPAHGILLNILFYAPLTLWLWQAPYGPKFQKNRPPPRPVRGFGDVVMTIEAIRGNRIITAMILLSGAAAFLVANGYQAQMPEFAADLGHGNAGIFYAMLLGADACGALVAGFALEASGWLQPRLMTPFILVMIWCCALGSFAVTRSYPVAVALMFAAGFVELSYNSMNQTLVQLHAPAEIRGRVLGLFSMAQIGLRTFAGISIGVVGSGIGIHHSLLLAVSILFVITGALFLMIRPAAVQVESGD
ncbi:MAG TPA: MFS transporter [Stellaceae bacterium]|nr:MFS transporter [Stellaceae bacterium]